MATTTPNLGLTLPARGASDWDVPVNENFTLIDEAFADKNIVDNETPSGTIDGTTGSDGNPTFAVAHTPNPVTSVHLTKNGQEMYVGIAFTFETITITYLAPYIPVTGDEHRVSYRY